MIVESKRLYVRRFEISDAKRMSEYRSKPEVSRYQSWRRYTLEEATKRIEQCLTVQSLNTVKTNYHLAIILKDKDILIGDLFVNVVNKHTFLLGYTLDSEYWSLGYAQEIIQVFLDFMKEQFNFNKVLCYVYPQNKRSVCLLQRLSFEQFEKSYVYGDVGFLKNL